MRKGAEVPVKYQYVAIEKIVNLKSLPRVELLTSHAQASGDLVDALLAHSDMTPDRPLRGLVVAGTGNGTIHQDLEAALLRAQIRGIKVLRATRCAMGRVLPAGNNVIQDSKGLSPVKARLALMLALVENA